MEMPKFEYNINKVLIIYVCQREVTCGNKVKTQVGIAFGFINDEMLPILWL